MKLNGGVRTKVLSTFLTTSDKRDVQVTGWIDLNNTSASAVKVTLTFFHKNKAGLQDLHKENEVVTVPAHSHLSVPVGMQCDALSLDDWEFGVFATPSAAGITVTAATQTVLAMGTDIPNGFAKRLSKNAVTLTATPKTILQTSVDFGDGSVFQPSINPSVTSTWNAIAQGWMNVVGGKTGSSVKLDYYMDSAYMGSITQIIGPDKPASVPLGFICDGAFTGQHNFTVMASHGSGGGEGMSARTGFMTIAGFADGSVMPTNGWDGDGQPVALTTKAQQLLSGELTTSAVSDAWMGGWITLENTADKARVVTVQAAMGGEAEGPPLLVTVPKHGKLSVPFGLLCDGEPAGTLGFDVMMSASANGVKWNGDGHVSVWAIAP